MGSQESTDPAWPGGGSDVDAGVRAVWHDLLVDGNESLRRFQRMFRRLPSAPRCKRSTGSAPSNGQGELPVGAAVHAGSAYVGNVGGQGVLDFTALGDPVNTAARLQAHAAAGELVMASELYAPIGHDHPGAVAHTVEVRGREQPVEVHVLHVAAGEH